MTQIHRKWTTFFRAQDRAAWYALKDEVEKDQAMINEIKGKLTALEG